MGNFWRSRAACVIALVAVLACGCARMWVGAGFPREGEEIVEVSDVAGEVRIDYDEWYVPHVRALSERDAMFGLGYAMASARLFQLDLYRRLARGELAGLTGPEIVLRDESGETTLDAVEIDLWLRLLDFADTGRRHLEASSPETKTRLAAFAVGVNAFARERGGELSAPYSVPSFLGGKEFLPWSPEDSAAIAAMLSFGLTQNL
ncbi:MAG: penicillin acylase family protein, partial [Deltaproteobacteria bacterium]|nr:penicillin acylase family protein [Deltaproteobacteria bacterium]